MSQKLLGSVLGAFTLQTAQEINDNFTQLFAGAGTILTADPANPADGTWWMRRTGASPAMEIELRARIAGVTYSVAGITI